MIAIIAWIGVAVGLVALVYARKLHQEVGVAQRRLDRYNRALFSAEESIRALQDELRDTEARLQIEILQRTGSKLHGDMSLREIRLMHPQADGVLAGLHIGGCSSCAWEPDATLASVCAQSHMDLNTVLNHLNALMNPGQPEHEGTVQPVKVPNVSLEI